MRIPRFFATGKDLQSLQAALSAVPDDGVQLLLSEEDLIKQIRVVLRLGKGAQVLLIDDCGRSGKFELNEVNKSTVSCTLLEQIKRCETWTQQVTVGLAMIKSDRFEWALEKLSELGVTEIVPLNTRNCVVKMPDAKGADKSQIEKVETKLRRWQSITREAAEQSERLTIPRVVKPQNFEDFVSGSDTTGDDCHSLRLICAERSQVTPLAKALTDCIYDRACASDGASGAYIESISLLIGPEGGFVDWEMELAEKHGWLSVSLGPRILRSETASIVAMAQVASVLDIANRKFR